MKIIGGKVHFDDTEVATFMPLWLEISFNDERLLQERRYLAEKLFWADEVGLMEGTEPLIEELVPFKENIEKKVMSLKPETTKEEFKEFTFFILHMDEDETNKK